MSSRPPISRRRFLLYQALQAGPGVLFATEAVSSTLLAHPEWDPEELVDPSTGEPVAPAAVSDSPEADVPTVED